MNTALNDKITYFKEYQEKIIKMEHELRSEAEKYKAEMKAAFGLADGENANVLSLIEAMQKVTTYQ